MQMITTLHKTKQLNSRRLLVWMYEYLVVDSTHFTIFIHTRKFMILYDDDDDLICFYDSCTYIHTGGQFHMYIRPQNIYINVNKF